jgi:hypothetical protein
VEMLPVIAATCCLLLLLKSDLSEQPRQDWWKSLGKSPLVDKATPGFCSYNELKFSFHDNTLKNPKGLALIKVQAKVWQRMEEGMTFFNWDE